MNRNKTDAVSYLVIVLCFVVAAIILVQVFRSITFTGSNDTELLEVLRLEIMIPANGFNSKNEKVYFSPIDGTIEREKIAGAVVRVGSPVLSIKTGQGSTEIQSESNGILSYIRDTLEGTYTVDNALNGSLTPQEITDPPTEFERVEDGKKVKEGEFICKVVDNEEISYVLLMNQKYFSKFQVGDSATFTLTYPSNLSVTGQITHLEPLNEKQVLVVFTTEFYVDVLLNTRKIEGYFTFGYQNAAILKPSTVKEVSPGEYAIYYLSSSTGKPVYTPIQIAGYQPGTEYYIVSSFGSKDETKPIENLRGYEVFSNWKQVEKDLKSNE
jgi:hypothetical protein